MDKEPSRLSPLSHANGYSCGALAEEIFYWTNHDSWPEVRSIRHRYSEIMASNADNRCGRRLGKQSRSGDVIAIGICRAEMTGVRSGGKCKGFRA